MQAELPHCEPISWLAFADKHSEGVFFLAVLVVFGVLFVVGSMIDAFGIHARFASRDLASAKDAKDVV